MANQRPFQVLVKPVGADCNLRCDYCFYLRAADVYPETPRHRMPENVLDALIGGMMRLRFPQTVFAWQGGEPTLAGVDFFKRVVALQQQHGVSGQSVSNSFQTNGILLNEDWCRLFHEYRFLVGLSLDGPEEIHDRIRHTPGGNGTWERVMESARLMDRTQVEYNILCVINAVNVGMGADLVGWFVREGFHYLQFIPCFEPENQYCLPAEAYGAFLCDVFDYWVKEGLEVVSIRDFESLLLSHMGMPGGLCTYGRKCNQYIVVEHNGDVYPRDFFVQNEWRLGNILETPIETFVEHPKYREFAAQKDKVPACRGCKYRDMCHSGCQKDRRNAGAPGSPTPFCRAYQRFFAHAAPHLKTLAKRAKRRMPQTSST